MSYPPMPKAFPPPPDPPPPPYVYASVMSLRDYFAAKALPTVITERHRTLEASSSTWHLCATIAYEIADAMLEERSK